MLREWAARLGFLIRFRSVRKGGTPAKKRRGATVWARKRGAPAQAKWQQAAICPVGHGTAHGAVRRDMSRQSSAPTGALPGPRGWWGGLATTAAARESLLGGAKQAGYRYVGRGGLGDDVGGQPVFYL